MNLNRENFFQANETVYHNHKKVLLRKIQQNLIMTLFKETLILMEDLFLHCQRLICSNNTSSFQYIISKIKIAKLLK